MHNEGITSAADNPPKEFVQSENDFDYSEEDGQADDLSVSPTNLNIAYRHWADTQTGKHMLTDDEGYGLKKIEGFKPYGDSDDKPNIQEGVSSKSLSQIQYSRH